MMGGVLFFIFSSEEKFLPMSFSSDVDRKHCMLQMPLCTVTASKVCNVASLGKGKDSSIFPSHFF